MDLKKWITERVEAEIEGSEYFIVDVLGGAESPKIQVLLDGDSGVSIDVCARISRRLSRMIDEEYDGRPFNLVISSPGVDRPLKKERQYPQHLGRTLEISFVDGRLGEFILLEVEEKGIKVQEVLRSEKKHIKNELGEIKHVPFTDIETSKVVISFN